MRARSACLAYSPDGRTLASGSEDRAVFLWDMPSGVKRTAMESHQSPVEAVAFHPDGKTLAYGTANGLIVLLNVVSFEQGLTIEGHTDRDSLPGLFAGRPGAGLGSWDKTAKLWEMPQRPGRGTLSGHAASHLCGFFTRRACVRNGELGWDGEAVACSHLPTSAPRFSDHEGGVFALAFASDGQSLAVGEGAGRIRLWNPATADEIGTLSGHTWAVYSLALTPDGRTLVSGSADGTVRIWDLMTLRERAAYQWHKSWVTSVAVSPDGMTAAAGGDDRTIVVWDLD